MDDNEYNVIHAWLLLVALADHPLLRKSSLVGRGTDCGTGGLSECVVILLPDHD
jgi:hypothetical protein